MNTNYRYTLASNKVPKLTCPRCQRPKHWQRYIDKETGEILPPQYGKCDNAEKCKEWVKPPKASGLSDTYQPRPQPKARPRVYIPAEVLAQTERNQMQSDFLRFLMDRAPFPFAENEVQKVAALYHLGGISKGKYTGAVTFPFIDGLGNVRAIQVKTFDKANHTTGQDFIHSIIEKVSKAQGIEPPEWIKPYNSQEDKVSCFFGLHLVPKYPRHRIALVEAPKTAIYGALYYGLPEQSDLLWLAVYSKQAFTENRFLSLAGREVIIYPDLSKNSETYFEWKKKAEAFQNKYPGRFTVRDDLESYATPEQRAKGADLADFLILADWRQFRQSITGKEQVNNSTEQP